ncbi:beta-N-acetylhexosaminidase [Streptomyces violaceus]|uniref:beta-N-acetylhexosaminidase n=1 Tax=Streptomyces violaceus TaxID=1936 RepID=A0ABY9U563_STRVL|nr:beta-N-acetylhexosaminidase [Streptomyces janthinus]WND16087.1 beta-N-acetylhexosaminidase [Streptomyces janthinus]GGS91280.1 beta-N-acetylhexosaminidase [Streptomyces janthinus]
MDLVPAPLEIRPGPVDGSPFVLGFDTRVASDAASGTSARWLRSVLGTATGLPLEPAAPGAEGAITLQVTERLVALGPEAYELVADASGVLIEGGGPAGVFWGAQTLRQLLGPDAFRRAPLGEGSWTVPPVRIADAPRFAWRGMMLDVARHFMPKDGVLRYVDLLAAHKLNVLHLHLTDDQGWRIEIGRYPRLTEVGSWRARSRIGLEGSPLWDERPHGGYYTQDDLREIVAYARERHITVVPEIDIPGHSQAAIAAYPELGNTDVVETATLEPWDDWGISLNVLNVSEATLAFYENVLAEVLEIFPSEFVHIGGDECAKEQWRASPTVQRRIRELGLADEAEMQSWFIHHFDRWLADRGRRLVGWDEILEGGVAPGAVVSSWQGYAGGIAAARAGHDVVMCPQEHVYLDWRQADGPHEPVPIAHVRTLEDVYRFEPVPDSLSRAEAAHVIGVQANVWTETMDSVRAVDYMVFPRLSAFAEVAWRPLPPSSERDFADFERRMAAAHYARLDALGVEYRPPSGPRPWHRRPGVRGRPDEGPPPVR